MHQQTHGKKALFICDAHLGSGTNEPKKERLLTDFLRNLSADRVKALYILGDLFDFWFEYESVILNQYFWILRELARVVERGIEVHLVVGNHDFWAGDFLINTIGMKIHRMPIEVDLDGLRVYMCHGDGLNPHDRGYRLLKPIIRSRFIGWCMQHMHPDRVTRMARWLSKFSRESASVAGKLREDDGIRQFALNKFNDGTDVVVVGHSHQPHDEAHSVNGQKKRYYNIGDVQERFTYLEYSEGEFILKRMESGGASSRTSPGR